MAEVERLFGPVRSVRTFDEVSSNIKELILDGTLKVGDRLPTEAQLAEQFGVGRQTIREALRLLERSGFVTIQRGGGGGSIIKDTVLRHVSDLFIDAFRMRSVTLKALTVARLEIEKVILEHAFENADQEDFEDLKANIAAARQRIAQGKPATELNAQFHRLLAKATKNEVFVIVLETMMAVHLDLLSRVGFGLDTSRKVADAHAEIVAAMIAGDRPLARRLLEEHLQDVRARLNGVENA